jgi:hypothetical protein
VEEVVWLLCSSLPYRRLLKSRLVLYLSCYLLKEEGSTTQCDVWCLREAEEAKTGYTFVFLLHKKANNKRTKLPNLHMSCHMAFCFCPWFSPPPPIPNRHVGGLGLVFCRRGFKFPTQKDGKKKGKKPCDS